MSTTWTGSLRELLEDMPDMLTREDISSLLRVHGRTLERWVEAGRFPKPVAPSLRCHRWAKTTVRRWLEQVSR
jgi:predicted DNA-binding transcriptional regulator AlpA